MNGVAALAGNPNCGKTTLFNALTGSHQYVGNWPGVTVEKREAIFDVNDAQITLIDLPGAYSLTPYSIEERVTADYLAGGEAGAVINIVDAMHLERSLLLTLQLLNRRLPVIVAINMMDELAREGGKIDIAALSNALGCPVVAISARRKTGFDELFSALYEKIAHPAESPAVLAADEDEEAIYQRVSALLRAAGYEKRSGGNSLDIFCRRLKIVRLAAARQQHYNVGTITAYLSCKIVFRKRRAYDRAVCYFTVRAARKRWREKHCQKEGQKTFYHKLFSHGNVKAESEFAVLYVHSIDTDTSVKSADNVIRDILICAVLVISRNDKTGKIKRLAVNIVDFSGQRRNTDLNNFFRINSDRECSAHAVIRYDYYLDTNSRLIARNCVIVDLLARTVRIQNTNFNTGEIKTVSDSIIYPVRKLHNREYTAGRLYIRKTAKNAGCKVEHLHRVCHGNPAVTVDIGRFEFFLCHAADTGDVIEYDLRVIICNNTVTVDIADNPVICRHRSKRENTY